MHWCRPSYIGGMTLKRIDLNLLITFDALWRERSVTRAARRLNVTQPTVSSSLSRLRDVFDDQLFLRTPKGIVPTERCAEVALDVQEALRHIESALDSSNHFDPLTCRQEFRVAAPDYFDQMLLPGLIRRLELEAPHVDLRLRSVPREEGIDMIDAGELDFMLHYEDDAPKRIGMQAAFSECVVFTARKGHPKISGPPDLETYISLNHVNFSQRGEPGSAVDEALAELGHKRRVALTTEHMGTVSDMVLNTDMVGSMPSRIAARLARNVELDVFPMPFELGEVGIMLHWNRRFERDGAHLWMRQLLLEQCASLPACDALFDDKAAARSA